MFRKAFAVMVVLALLFAPGAASSAQAAAADKCTAEQGQSFIDAGRYKDAIREFTCVIEAHPTEVEGYRGRIEAELLLGRFSDAVRDYAGVTAFVEPVHPDAKAIILAGYDARLAVARESITALTGLSFARWWYFDYAAAIHVLHQLLALQPDDLYGNLFRGSSRFLQGVTPAKGEADIERALAIAPLSPDVHYVVADAYFYGRADYARAIAEATFALDGGLDTPRVHAILASAYLALGNLPVAAAHFEWHMELVTTELIPTSSALEAGDSMTLGLVPGRTYEIPVPAVAGETISILTGSPDFYDTIIVLLGPDGTPVTGGDDYKIYFAGFQYDAPAAGTYRLWATSFEGVNTGDLVVSRK